MVSRGHGRSDPDRQPEQTAKEERMMNRAASRLPNQQVQMDAIFRALADPSRRHLLDRLNECNGQTLGELCAGFEMARQSVSKHLAVLEEASLITTLWRGCEYTNHTHASHP